MEKPKTPSINDLNKPKKSPTNFVRNTGLTSPDTTKKASAAASKKNNLWIKKQDRSWDY